MPLPLIALVAAVVFWPAGLVLALVSLRRHPDDRALTFAGLGVSVLFGVATVALAGGLLLAFQASTGKTDADSVQALRAVRGDLSANVLAYEAAVADDPSLARSGDVPGDDIPGLRFSRFTDPGTLVVEQREGSYCMEAATTEEYGSRMQHYDSATYRYLGGSCAAPTALVP